MKYSYDTTAFAKINLFLRICGKLPNGYHRLFTLMQEISLGDEVSVEIDDSKPYEIKVLCDRADLDMQQNICYKAAVRFFNKYSKYLRNSGVSNPEDSYGLVEISVNKTTPSEAGLGGGSADAAAVLRILQEHYNNPFTLDELVGLAVGIGADVPFFLYGGTAICEGVGEEVRPVPSLGGLNLIIVKPAPGVSTPKCFKAVDAEPIVFDEDEYKAAIGKIYDNDGEGIAKLIASKDLLINDLQKPAVDEVPQISELISALDDAGSVMAAMSGSGSSVFGFFANEEDVNRALEIIGGDPRLHDCKIYPAYTI